MTESSTSHNTTLVQCLQINQELLLQDCRRFLLLCHMFKYFFYNTPHPLHSWYSDWLRAGWYGVRIPTDFFSSPKTVQSGSGSTQRGSFMKLTSHPHIVPGLRMDEYASTPSVRLYDVEWGSFTIQIIPSPRNLNCTYVNTK